MLPWNPDFIPATSTYLFLGAFFAVVAVVATTLGVAALRAFRDVSRGRAATVRWLEEFEELPEEARACRHALTGELPGRICPRAFACSGCERHARLVAERSGDPAAAPPADSLFGFDFPSDRLYHRGHAWARPEEDGSVTVGLDDLSSRIVGALDAVVLPGPGERIAENGPAFRLHKGSARVRVAAPVTGTVVETGGPGRDFYLRVRPDAPFDGASLLSGREVAAWVLREWDRLQVVLAGPRAVPALADGGVPLADLSKTVPDAERDRVLGEFLLDP